MTMTEDEVRNLYYVRLAIAFAPTPLAPLHAHVGLDAKG